ncbi:MAG: GAK system ATP-grasp enzyme [Deltaproteobacteria bacterium]|nr:GAK system ATP-grasp enzyme [Deltaproteobacteria bacterium]
MIATEKPKVAVVGIEGGWSSERLLDALDERTGFRCLVDMAQVRCDLASGRAYFNDVELTALDGLVIKKVGAEYSPELLDRLELLRFIASQGPRIFSPPASIMAMLDRLSCTVTLTAGGIPMPATVVSESVEEAARAVERMGRSVLKPLYSTKARGMLVVEPGPGLRGQIAQYRDAGHPMIYLQQMLSLPGQDLGVVFLGGKYLATYARVANGNSWNTTRRAGGRYQSYEPSQQIKDLAHKAQALFNLDFTCVDVAETAQGPAVFEVSAFGGFRGLKEGCGMDAAQHYADYVCRELAS